MTSETGLMPLSTSSITAQFTGIGSELLSFFHEVGQLVDIFRLLDEACITAALQYMDKYEADLWTYLEETSGDNYEEFANAVLRFYPEQPVEVIINKVSEVKSPAPVPSTDSSISSADIIACLTDDLSSDEYENWDDLLSKEYVHWSNVFDPFTDEPTSINELPFYDNIESSAISETSDSILDTYPQIIAPLASTNHPHLTVSNASWAMSQKYCPETALHDPSSLPVLCVVTQEAGVIDVGNPSFIFASHDLSSLPVLCVVTWEARIMDVDFPSTVLTIPFILRISSILCPGLLRRHLKFTSAFPSDDFRVIQDIPDDHIGLLASYSHICFNDLLWIESASNSQLDKNYQPIPCISHPSTNDLMTIYPHIQVSTLHMSPSHVSSALSVLRIHQIASVQSLQETTHIAIQAQDQPPSYPPTSSDTTHPETSDPCSIHPDKRIPHILQHSYWYQVHPSATPIVCIASCQHALNQDRKMQEYILPGTNLPLEYNISDHMVGIDINKPDEEEPDSNIGAVGEEIWMLRVVNMFLWSESYTRPKGIATGQRSSINARRCKD
ncbi:hypothetical protein DFH29DRAFT_1000932 [Suillus ampliporus]|nr:hypothetical protein DFH29DRAFT_1000932 [Suillus ampliporus]